jgi:hypothetical protein
MMPGPSLLRAAQPKCHYCEWSAQMILLLADVLLQIGELFRAGQKGAGNLSAKKVVMAYSLRSE